ncbi:unnamed protein product [Owenia fusiformis]|uniref:Uncharacterized protein n=1 Tax=Owenia fusiformis TaxID=6347 RepID=A0A8J1UA99_OWEFU|nr:unnamed protein product [Owenia fusiformis]
MAEATRTVVLPVDLSDHAEAAFDWFVDHIHKEGDNVIILFSQDCTIPSSTFYQQRNVEVFQNIIKTAKENAKELVNKYNAKLKTTKMKGKVECIFDSVPGQGIVKFAKENQASLVVMGSRGLGAVRRTILGSVSDYVLHHSHCPIVIIPKH